MELAAISLFDVIQTPILFFLLALVIKLKHRIEDLEDKEEIIS